jgi:hypothetical protein
MIRKGFGETISRRLAMLALTASFIQGCGAPDNSDRAETEAAERPVLGSLPDPEAERAPPLPHSSLTPAERRSNTAWQEHRLAMFGELFDRFPDGGRWLDVIEAYILAGEATTDFPAVAYLINKPADRGRCSGTLVSCNAVLTAAHCFKQDGLFNTQAANYEVYFQHGGLIGVTSVHRYCDGKPDCSSDLHDLAIAILDRRPRIVAYGIASAVEWAGQPSVIAGFGVSSTASDRGLKRWGPVTPEACTDRNSCFEITGSHSNCTADSGGPLLTRVDNSLKLLGVAKKGGAACDQVKGKYVSMIHSDYSAWAKSVIQSNSCASAPFQLATAVKPPSVMIDSQPKTFELPSGTAVVQANLNFELGFGNDFDLVGPPGASCRRSAETVSCELAGPYSASATLQVQRLDELADPAFYQLIVVTQ